jgi:hypothetical protein
MAKDEPISLFNSEPKARTKEVKFNHAQEWLVYITVGLFVPFCWLCNHYPWGGLALLISVPSWVLAAIVARYYQDLAARWMHKILIVTFAVHSLLIFIAITLWRMSPVLKRIPELDLLAGVVIVILEVLILGPVLRRYMPKAGVQDT